MRKLLYLGFLFAFLYGCNELRHVTADEFKWQYQNRDMQSVYSATYLGERDGKIYLLRKRAPLIGSKWKEEILFTEVAGLDTVFLKTLREREKASKETPNVAILWMTLENLNLDNPAEDVEKYIVNNDFRFVGINSYSCSAPGVDNLSLTQKYGIRCLEGTSDVIEAEVHMRLFEEAIRYAEKYNCSLLEKLKMN